MDFSNELSVIGICVLRILLHWRNYLYSLKAEFPGLEEQIQLDDVLENDKMREFFRTHFRAFLHFLEDTEPSLANHTGYMKKMHKHILKG